MYIYFLPFNNIINLLQKVVTYFYDLILIPLGESAQDLTDLLVEKLKQDDLYDTMKDNIVSFVSGMYPNFFSYQWICVSTF